MISDLFQIENEMKVVRSKIQDLFFRDPFWETAAVMEILRDVLFSDSMLREEVISHICEVT
jgi:hypothetical protein